MMHRMKLLKTFELVAKAAARVAARLRVDVETDDWLIGLNNPPRLSAVDPQIVLNFAHRERRFSILVIANAKGMGISVVPDGDIEIEDAEGYRADPWRAAVLEELAVDLRHFLPRESIRLQKTAAAIHAPPPWAVEALKEREELH